MTGSTEAHRAHADYDVVVVGAGSAGCLVAARLAEAGSRSALLLEAGPDLRADPPPLMHDGWRTLPGHDWGYVADARPETEPEPLPRGRVVGGTSWKTRFAMRGTAGDFAQWERLGCRGWAYDDVLPYFVRLENDLEFGAEPWHGTDGPLPITRYPDQHPSPFECAWMSAFEASGFGVIDDHNRPGAVGAGRMPRNGSGGRRVTGADTHLAPGRTPPNLHVRGDAEVATVVFDGTEATGVRLRDGTVIHAGWVVLSAGTYGSPTLLLRSGVGPAQHLRHVGIDVVADLPGVGANLADHPGFDIDPGFRGDVGVAPRMFSLATFLSSAATDDAPDLAVWVYDPWGGPDDPAETAFAAVVLSPRSRGSVRLRSADPADPPHITLPGCSDPFDVARLAEGAERVWELVHHPDVRRLCELPPAPRPTTRHELEDVVRSGVWSFPHVVGTCAMGASPEAGAVVDSDGRVHGLHRLSVVDASVIPASGAGFPHLVSMMVAERLSERIAASL
jgi:choline dehydrogenase